MIQRGSFVPRERVNVTRSSYRSAEGQKKVRNLCRRKRRRRMQIAVRILLFALAILMVAGIVTVFTKGRPVDKRNSPLPANETPVLATPETTEHKVPKGKLIVIDPGHGGHDPGTGNTVYEKEINLAIALRLRDLLVASGYDVIMTRESDVFISLEERAGLSNRSQADLFISIHQNALENDSVTDGAETYYSEGDHVSARLAQLVQTGIVQQTGADDRGINNTQDFYVNSNTTAPSVLIECGFMSATEEFANLQKEDYQNKMAAGILSGIEAYFAE